QLILFVAGSNWLILEFVAVWPIERTLSDMRSERTADQACAAYGAGRGCGQGRGTSVRMRGSRPPQGGAAPAGRARVDLKADSGGLGSRYVDRDRAVHEGGRPATSGQGGDRSTAGQGVNTHWLTFAGLASFWVKRQALSNI